jgi:hypothetical protein
MKNGMLGFCLAALLSLAVGCSKEKAKEEVASAKEGTGEAAHAHAPKDAKPGSYEDWCGEHEVPESQCTLCHPELAAAFKATGDWCQEHSLPKSHCRKCDPNLKIVRPAKVN